ncbi:50S ribosomal protein L18 [Defluviitalea saccharophila]|uniref:Large ribosomal subunit protein uL18 n=1 Tax=Defluviitalea saccharophila TaxID=879970 RepID=A0ABZ2Y1A6_9FIRM|nr:50S ribosomal protein L18 [Candidatus Epulonipiscium sp.]
MIRKESRSEVRAKKHLKIRKKIQGTTQRPRLSVFRSDKHIYAQIIDDVKGTTVVAASTLEKDITKQLEKTNTVQAAKVVGEIVARRALDKGVTEVVFDRGGYIYHGKVKALADAAREAGLQF